jgi:hypothetical protein
MKKVPAPKVATATESTENPLPPKIQRRWASWWGRRRRACSP